MRQRGVAPRSSDGSSHHTPSPTREQRQDVLSTSVRMRQISRGPHRTIALSCAGKPGHSHGWGNPGTDTLSQITQPGASACPPRRTSGGETAGETGAKNEPFTVRRRSNSPVFSVNDDAHHGKLKRPRSSPPHSHRLDLRGSLHEHARSNTPLPGGPLAPGIPPAGRRRLRRPGAGMARSAGSGAGRAEDGPTTRTPRSLPTSRRRPSGSSSCSCTAGRATWKRSTPSPTFSASPASTCPRVSAWSPPAARWPITRCSPRSGPSGSRAERDRGLRLLPPPRTLRR